MGEVNGPTVPAGVEFRVGDALDCLRGLASGSVQAIVTSPPYYRQRHYGAPNEIGLERTPAQYVGRIADVMDECFRVLADDGCLFLNLGDTYASRARGARSGGNRTETRETGMHNGFKVTTSSLQALGAAADTREHAEVPAAVYGRPPKSLLMIPARVAIEMQDRGWVLRADNIWRKPNPMPEAVKDRTTLCHEHVFHFVKQTSYRYDADAVAEPAQWDRWGKQTVLKAWDQEHSRARFIRESDLDNLPVKDRRNLHSVWTFTTANYAGAHFAVMPETLPDLCIRASTQPGDTVLDPFMGAGTVLLAAVRLGRRAVGIDANPECLQLARERLSDVQMEAA